MNKKNKPRKLTEQLKLQIRNEFVQGNQDFEGNRAYPTLEELTEKFLVAKSTLYRVLNDLKKINILNEFTNPENATVVELLLEDDSHHHHLFCSDCGEIIDIQMGDEFEKTLSKEIKRIEKKFNFSIEDHRLELFGKCTNLCENCS